jgi:hypothetical protein
MLRESQLDQQLVIARLLPLLLKPYQQVLKVFNSFWCAEVSLSHHQQVRIRRIITVPSHNAVVIECILGLRVKVVVDLLSLALI